MIVGFKCLHSGYTYSEIISEIVLLNNYLHQKPREQLMTVKNKYSHQIFFAVAKTPLLTNEELSANSPVSGSN